MKQRFSILDLRTTVNELSSRLTGTFIQNFYSTQQRFMYIKFSNKDTLLIEPGFRLHLTQSPDSEISHFCKKLREKCRHARIHKIYQYGFDRIVIIDLQRVKILVEFFSAGNILILDENDMILDLLRPVEELGIIKNTKYVFNPIKAELTFELFKSTEDLSTVLPFEKEYIEILLKRLEEEFSDSLENLKQEKYRESIDLFFKDFDFGLNLLGWFGEVTFTKGKPNQIFPYKTVTKALDTSQLDKDNISDKKYKNDISNDIKNLSINNNNDIKPDDNDIKQDDNDIKPGDNDIKNNNDLKSSNNNINNNNLKIIIRNKEEIDDLISKNKGITAIHFQSFNEAAEFYFSDSQKKKKIKEDKGTRIRKAQERYIEELKTQADEFKDTTEVIEENKEMIQEILSIFKKVYSTKMEWSAFEAFWEEEKRRGNEVAKAIVSYDLENKKCIILLEEHYVELDLSVNLSKNIERLFLKRKKAIDKKEKTEEALENIVQRLAPKREIVPAQKREIYWFEKFHFFISTENELVIGGRNAQENEMIVKKYLESTDLYFHSEAHGASSIACKGRAENTIEEASYMALCMSKCWDDGVIKPVFYVDSDQVSKSAPSGEYLSKGSFMIRGKKNIKNPYRLEYGVGLIFKLEDSKSLIDFSKNPDSDSKIVHGMPMAAPWIAIKDFKYKVRICPGGEKKSQICQDIKKLFEKQSEGSGEEKLVKAIGIDEYMRVVPGKSKIAKIIK